MMPRCKFIHNLPCEQVSDRIAELEKENEGLKRTVDEVTPRLIEESAKLENENAKLRELVKHLYDYRELYFRTGIYPTDHGMTERRMRELRIEVSHE